MTKAVKIGVIAAIIYAVVAVVLYRHEWRDPGALIVIDSSLSDAKADDMMNSQAHEFAATEWTIGLCGAGLYAVVLIGLSMRRKP